jgi:ankyrin repeat protein
MRRLVELDRLIRDLKYPNARTFADEWGVDSKTIQRDIAFLRDELEAPLDYDRRERGYFYTRSYELPALVHRVASVEDTQRLDPNEALFNAAALGETNRIAELKERGGDVNWQEPKDQWTPLMAAAWGRWADVVKVLLKAGARMDRKNVSGDSAITYAVKSGDANIVRQLLTAAAKQGLKADQIALNRARSELVRKLNRLNEMLQDLGDYPT